MTKGIDRLLLGSAFVFGGLLHRRVGLVDDRMETIARSVDERKAASPATARDGMALPTGYGLQVRGPVGEDLLVPVCLPPGFELGSLVLRPSFLPEEHAPAAQPARRPAPVGAVRPLGPRAVPDPRPTAERLDAAIQLIYSDDAAFHTHIDASAALAPPPVPAPFTERLRSIL